MNNEEKPTPEALCQAIAKGFPDKVFENADVVGMKTEQPASRRF